MRTFQDAVVAKSRDMDAFSPEAVLPIAVIPSVKVHAVCRVICDM